MPGWLIIIIVCIVIGAIIGFFASLSEDDSPTKGCLGGALMGGASGMGCLAVILETILPIIIAVLVFSWLLKGCS